MAVGGATGSAVMGPHVTLNKTGFVSDGIRYGGGSLEAAFDLSLSLSNFNNSPSRSSAALGSLETFLRAVV